jgi:hypothetical protein
VGEKEIESEGEEEVKKRVREKEGWSEGEREKD